ncbi:putative transposase-like protein [Trichonephila clavipes]|nr:putative transposase-like protein [Trichonephila clavipes]
MNIKLKNDIPVCQRARRLSCSEKLQVNNQIDDWLRQGYQHLRVNHSLTFKNPETSAHTNSIEGTWSAIKRSLRNHAAHVEGEFDHYLAEYMWRRRRGHSLDDDVFREFLRAITTLYPPMEEDVPS